MTDRSANNHARVERAYANDNSPRKPKMISHLVWIMATVLRFGGLLALVAGVAVFGVYFVGENGRAAKQGDGTIPVSSWLGAGPRKGMRIFALGAGMLLCASVLGWIAHH